MGILNQPEIAAAIRLIFGTEEVGAPVSVTVLLGVGPVAKLVTTVAVDHRAAVGVRDQARAAGVARLQVRDQHLVGGRRVHRTVASLLQLNEIHVAPAEMNGVVERVFRGDSWLGATIGLTFFVRDAYLGIIGHEL